MTRRPMRPIAEKGILYENQNYDWDANGDFSVAILQLVIFPFVFPYVLLKRLIK